MFILETADQTAEQRGEAAAKPGGVRQEDAVKKMSSERPGGGQPKAAALVLHVLDPIFLTKDNCPQQNPLRGAVSLTKCRPQQKNCERYRPPPKGDFRADAEFFISVYS
ncbi:MAG: hypothetical protein AAB466_11240 [Verrucomicrobiota bacterium]